MPNDARLPHNVQITDGGGRPFSITGDQRNPFDGGGAPFSAVSSNAVYVPGNDASTSPNAVGALPMAEPLDADMQGTVKTLTDVSFPPSAWAPVLRAQLIVAEFGMADWRCVDIPAPTYDADDLRDEILTLITLRDQRASRLGEIVAQAQDFTNYFADVLMISPASHPASWALLCAGEAIGQTVGMFYKNIWADRPRPVQVYPPLMTAIPTPPHPSYPNAHALQAGLIAAMFADVCDALRPSLALLVDRIAENRAIAGLHFVSDKIGSEKLVDALAPMLLSLDSYKKIKCLAIKEWKNKCGLLPVAGRTLPRAAAPLGDAVQDDNGFACEPVLVQPKISVSGPGSISTPPNWPARNQGNRSTCVAFAVTACAEDAICAAGQYERLSEQFLYWAARQVKPDPHEAADVIRLKYASQVLQDVGISTAAVCPYDMSLDGTDPGPEPSDDVKQEAAGRTFDCGTYYDIKNHQVPPNGVPIATTVANLLTENKRPVAVCLKMFQNPTTNQSAWTATNAIHYGIIDDPAPTDTLVNSHCICIVRWWPDNCEPSGGYFVFRNSWGGIFAERAHSSLAPAVPGPGYGVISATYINTWSYEILQVGAPK
jgi:Papain family cysteine protease